MAEPIQIVRWEGLTPNQQRVLTSAMERQVLSMLYLLWEPNEDRRFNQGRNNRGRVYAEALIPAAVELIRMGLIGVATKDPELRVLTEDEAVVCVEKLENWWRYRVISGLDDPLDPGPSRGIEPLFDADYWTSPYSLTQVNRDRFTISSWQWPPRMDALRRAS